jgi:argininosuccinate lyase
MSVLSVLSQAIQKISLNREKMAGAILPSLMATDIADYLVQKGIPFREAHHITGRLILHAEQNNVNLDQLELVDFQSYHADIDVGIFECLLPAYSVARRNAVGGTAPEAVKLQIEQALQAVNSTYR